MTFRLWSVKFSPAPHLADTAARAHPAEIAGDITEGGNDPGQCRRHGSLPARAPHHDLAAPRSRAFLRRRPRRPDGIFVKWGAIASGVAPGTVDRCLQRVLGCPRPCCGPGFLAVRRIGLGPAVTVFGVAFAVACAYAIFAARGRAAEFAWLYLRADVSYGSQDGPAFGCLLADPVFASVRDFAAADGACDAGAWYRGASRPLPGFVPCMVVPVVSLLGFGAALW
jgi:hypothetical protein